MSWPPLLAAIVAGAANLLGAAAVTWRSGWSRSAHVTLIALAAGFMIGVCLVDLLPTAFATHGAAAGVWAVAGFALVHVTQHTLGGHFHFGEETHPVTWTMAMSALAGLLLHTLFDGVAIGSAFTVRPPLGWLTFSAIGLHKIPEGFAIGSLCLAAGASRRAALSAAALLGSATVLGVTLSSQIGPLASVGLPLAAGVTLYVGASNLVPEFQSDRKWRDTLVFLGGISTYLLLRWVVGVH